MPVELRMPGLGMTMEEGTVIAWLVKEGDQVSRGQVIVQIESEKVAYDLEAPADGVIGKILVPAEGVVPVGTPLVLILGPGETGEATVQPAPQAAEAQRPQPLGRQAGERPDRQRLSPRARKLAEELGVNASTLVGSGPGGSVVEKDIREAARGGTGRAAVAESIPVQPPFTVHPLTSMRRTIADRMAASAREAPHFFLAVEVDASALLHCREAQGARLKAETGVELTISDFLLRLTAQLLAKHRALNASYFPDGIRQWHEVNLGLAVAVEDGLVVPVIRRADRRSLGELMVARSDLVGRARARKLTLDDLQGGTFTLSNLGHLGIDFFTSILNPPQGGILSVGAIREHPAVVGGQVVVRPRMVVGLTIDHRVTDGAAGARFLGDLRSRAEAPGLGE
ncbi:MAG: 2-oxo acid dehydrogenase subunit E2 [Candidatus Rokubacteria bacterium]|nr:2-oxo acid dehydrogenase subunit E2 [Candidatus Rokubacteria bacterium]